MPQTILLSFWLLPSSTEGVVTTLERFNLPPDGFFLSFALTFVNTLAFHLRGGGGGVVSLGVEGWLSPLFLLPFNLFILILITRLVRGQTVLDQGSVAFVMNQFYFNVFNT